MGVSSFRYTCISLLNLIAQSGFQLSVVSQNQNNYLQIRVLAQSQMSLL